MDRATVMRVSFVLAIALAAWACRSEDIPSDCNEARAEIQADIYEECKSLDLVGTSYCRTCVLAGYYSYRKTNSSGACECGPLEFSADFCAEQRNREKLRSAIRFANDDCATFNLPPDGGGRELGNNGTAAPPQADGGDGGD